MARFCRIPVAVVIGAGFLSACSSTENLMSSSAPESVTETEQTTAVEIEQPAPSPVLTYEWDTGFSSFLTPPVEVRRLAKADCMAEGYEIAVVETMVLQGSTATARYICRGDSE